MFDDEGVTECGTVLYCSCQCPTNHIINNSDKYQMKYPGTSSCTMNLENHT